MVYDKTNRKILLKPKLEVLVIESFDNKLYVNASDHLYILKELDSHQEFSKEFDQIIEKPKPRKIYIPPLTHP